MIGTKITHNAPATGIIKYWIGRLLLAVLGWQVGGQLPQDKKFILIGSPHTSNWDLPIGLAFIYMYRLKARWLGKHTLFKWPYGLFMRALGGIPVDRSQSHGVVGQIADEFRRSEKLVIILAPSGTRTKMPHWKSGFYHIAQQANIPVVCGYLDYKNKVANFGYTFVPTGNVKEDMDRVREYYKGIEGKYPEKMTPVRLVEEQ
ncbi:MAG: lysophospholipid acyltransferase family protein [Gammaproteobacteria bacterium]|nr:lysophospholipid acyltransferase family protein [Gammaproteobacteria bacterium]